MTGLYAFWFATIVGAILFFVAGMVASRRRGLAVATPLESPEALAQAHRAMEDLRLSHQNEVAVANQRQVELQAEVERAHAAASAAEEDASTKVQGDPSEERAAYDRVTEDLQSRLTKAQQELATVKKTTLMGMTAKSIKDKSSSAGEVASLGASKAKAEQQVAQLQKQLKQQNASNVDLQAKLKRAGTDASKLADSQAIQTRLQTQANDSKQKNAENEKLVRAQKSELEALRRKVAEGDGRQAELVGLRSQLATAGSAEQQVSDLKKKIAALEAQGLASLKPLPVAQTSKANSKSNESQTIRDQLLSVINTIAGQAKSNAVVLADKAGLPVVTAGEHSAELAAYASLVSELAGKATQFLPVAQPDHVDFVDKNGSTISVWPFYVETENLSLIMLSNSKSSVAAPEMRPTVRGAVADVAEILNQSSLIG